MKKNLKFKTKNVKLRKGLTLIELIIYIGIIGIVLIAVIDLSTRLVYSQSKQASVSEVQQNMRYAVERMTSSIENAKQINGSYPSNTLDLNVGASQIIYRLNGTVLEISEDGGSNYLPLTSSKVTLSSGGGSIFSKITNGASSSVKISFDIYLTTDINNKQTVSTTVLLRGK